MGREVIVDLEVLNQVIRYLADRPYKEVVDLIDALKATVRDIPDEETDKEEKRETERSKPKGFGTPK